MATEIEAIEAVILKTLGKCNTAKMLKELKARHFLQIDKKAKFGGKLRMKGKDDDKYFQNVRNAFCTFWLRIN